MLRFLATVTVASAAVLAGCAHDYQTASYAETTSAPVAIEKSPSVSYEGRPVYLVEDKWYFREGSQWRYFLEEPPPLRKRREQWQRGEVDRRSPRNSEDLEQRRESREEREEREDRHLVK